MLDWREITLRLIMAAFLSGIIGYEREIHGRAAGLRTTILVGVGSCLIMIVSMNLHEIYRGIATVDPARIPAQVVSGIGFLGAGTILRFHASVRGLTTAAALWAVAGIGLAIGSGFYAGAVSSTAIIFLVLVILSRFERRIKRETDKILNIDISGGMDNLCQITQIISEQQVDIQHIDIVSAADNGIVTVKLNLKMLTAGLSGRLVEALLKVKGVTAVKWE